ncbi:hypothetical protein BGX24_005915 [Mortierella sp. AD032]|nr:hypothetical protein BGX24_005915 [Mortierella sp. AD032]
MVNAADTTTAFITPTSEAVVADISTAVDGTSEKPVLPDLDYIVPTWFKQQAEGHRFMAVFYLPNTTTPVGMGGVELQDFDRQDKDVADLETGRGCIVSLFLYKQYRGKGYLGKILSICEEIAREQGKLKVLTIYGLSKAGGYKKFGYTTFKVGIRNYGGANDWETQYLEKVL